MTKLCIALARVCALQILITLTGNAAAQQPYPSKPVRFIVPFAPGGGTDITARLIAQKVSDLSHQVSVLENQVSAVLSRIGEVEKVNSRMEEAALITARALAEISGHWDAVYEAMRRTNTIND